MWKEDILITNIQELPGGQYEFILNLRKYASVTEVEQTAKKALGVSDAGSEVWELVTIGGEVPVRVHDGQYLRLRKRVPGHVATAVL